MRYALALVCAACVLALTPFALADQGNTTPVPAQPPTTAPCAETTAHAKTEIDRAFAHKRWRVEHPGRAIHIDRCYDASPLKRYRAKVRRSFFRHADREFRACAPQDCQLYASRQVSQSQMRCLVPLWSRESGWSRTAHNSSSGAHGIPQALPGSKMGPGWVDDGKVQIEWGLDYIGDRYGTPCNANAVQSSQGWY